MTRDAQPHDLHRSRRRGLRRARDLPGGHGLCHELDPWFDHWFFWDKSQDEEDGSFFDGIGSGPCILHDLLSQPPLLIAWETDPVCCAITSTSMTGTHHQDTPSEAAKFIRSQAENTPHQLWILAGPPCPDFSRIKDNAPGRSGAEGAKMESFCTLPGGA